MRSMVEREYPQADRPDQHDNTCKETPAGNDPAGSPWAELRKRPADLKFRHQHPAGPYILDFYCPAVDLAIEIDCEAHGRGDRPERDAARDDWLQQRGVRVLRISAGEVLGDLEAVVRYIVFTARG